MDLGMSELRAQLRLKLKAEFETVIDSVMSRACTGCKKVPIERPKTDWHHIMRYRHPARAAR